MPVAHALQPHLSWQQCPAIKGRDSSAAAMRCGWFYPGTHLAGQTVRLRVTRLQARPDQPSAHPVIYVPGGPGDPAGLHAEALWRWRAFQQEAGWPRDLVLYDPRSTGLSRPRPSCPDQRQRDPHGRLQACFRSLGPTNANALGLQAQVQDLHRLIRSLDVGPVVLWAHSYGAWVARRLAAQHPHDVQMLILESPALTYQTPAQRQGQAYQRRRRQLMHGCRQQLSCRLATPSLERVIDSLLARYGHKPRRVNLALPPWAPRVVKLDEALLQQLILMSAYESGRNRTALEVLGSMWRQPERLAYLAAPMLALRKRAPAIAPVYWSSLCQLADQAETPSKDACDDWPVRRLQARSWSNRHSVLAISGQQDILIPTRLAADWAMAMPSWQQVSIPAAGHDVLKENAAAQRLVRRFLLVHGAWLR